jgi:Flp pilus assembly protein CpaB
MRATTLFALTIALVLGLGAAAAAKYFGLLEPRAAAAPPPPAPPPPVMVLVAGTNLFKGHALTANDVKVREARQDELDDVRLNKKDYLPAVVNAANYRVMSENLMADTPIKIKHLEPQDFDNLEKRISPYMRAVNLDLPKARCAGGMIQKDDRVDVLMTTNVAAGSDKPLLRTAWIARDVRVVAKRNSLLTALAVNPDVVPFTLEANPYRAALIAFAEQKGTLTLVPRAAGKPTLAIPPLGRPTFSDSESDEYRDEDERVQKVENLEYAVSEVDLVRIFKLPPIPVKVPPPPPTRVAVIKGTERAGEQVFGPNGRPLPKTTDAAGREIDVPEPPASDFEPKTYAFARPEEDAKSSTDSTPKGMGFTSEAMEPVNVHVGTNNPNLNAPPRKPRN